jgi:hypothetical protein
MKLLSFLPREWRRRDCQDANRPGESAVGREVNQQLVDLAEGQHAAIELVIQQMAAALTIVGDEVFVIPGDVNPCICCGVRKPTSIPLRWLKRNTGWSSRTSVIAR